MCSFLPLLHTVAWSSTREPEQVFELLEHIYRAFDRIALRRNVFKVETIGECLSVGGWQLLTEPLLTSIVSFQHVFVRSKLLGDCYVAVTGLPKPQEDHAVIMAKFARDCMAKMAQLTSELVHSLGEDTATLEMRVGMHSGSVTGGVLRGQKSRFQLFGDTMNTGKCCYSEMVTTSHTQPNK